MEQLKMSPILTDHPVERSCSTESLPDLPLFEGLNDRHREILAECSMHASFRAGEKVVETGEPADCFYLIISGSIGLEAPGGRAPLPIKNIGAGDILGWSWLFPPDCWHFDAIAGEPTEVIYFYASRLRQECDRDQGLGYELFKRLAQRNGEGKSTRLTPDTSDTIGFPSGPESDNEPLRPFVRGNLNAFVLTADSARESRRNGSQSVTWWPKVLLESAVSAFRSAVRASGDRPAPALPRG
jgi:CRP/FNR family cyclic AMP-dependent transcriptional regulator